MGQALAEHTIYDKDSGQLLSGSFMDYALPRADIVPPVQFDMHNSLCTTNPLGVKGVGEAGTVGSLAAIINAVNDALVSSGAEPIDMPASPDRVWAALAAAKKER